MPDIVHIRFNHRDRMVRIISVAIGWSVEVYTMDSGYNFQLLDDRCFRAEKARAMRVFMYAVRRFVYGKSVHLKQPSKE